MDDLKDQIRRGNQIRENMQYLKQSYEQRINEQNALIEKLNEKARKYKDQVNSLELEKQEIQSSFEKILDAKRSEILRLNQALEDKDKEIFKAKTEMHFDKLESKINLLQKPDYEKRLRSSERKIKCLEQRVKRRKSVCRKKISKTPVSKRNN